MYKGTTRSIKVWYDEKRQGFAVEITRDRKKRVSSRHGYYTTTHSRASALCKIVRDHGMLGDDFGTPVWKMRPFTGGAFGWVALRDE